MVEEVAHQPGLADAGLALDDEQAPVRLSLADRLQLEGDLGYLVGSPHDGLAARHLWRQLGHRGEHAGLPGNPLEGARRKLLEDDAAPRCQRGLGVGQNPPVGFVHQPGGPVHRIAHHGVLPAAQAADIAEEHRAGADRSRKLVGHGKATFVKVGTKCGHRLDRPQRVIVVDMEGGTPDRDRGCPAVIGEQVDHRTSVGGYGLLKRQGELLDLRHPVGLVHLDPGEADERHADPAVFGKGVEEASLVACPNDGGNEGVEERGIGNRDDGVRYRRWRDLCVLEPLACGDVSIVEVEQRGGLGRQHYFSWLGIVEGGFELLDGIAARDRDPGSVVATRCYQPGAPDADGDPERQPIRIHIRRHPPGLDGVAGPDGGTGRLLQVAVVADAPHRQQGVSHEVDDAAPALMDDPVEFAEGLLEPGAELLGSR